LNTPGSVFLRGGWLEIDATGGIHERSIRADTD